MQWPRFRCFYDLLSLILRFSSTYISPNWRYIFNAYFFSFISNFAPPSSPLCSLVPQAVCQDVDVPDFWLLSTFWQVLTAGQTRVFDIFINNVLKFPLVNIFSLAENALYMPVQLSTNLTLTANAEINITISPLDGTSLGPLVNALEIHSLHRIQSRTLDRDGTQHFLLFNRRDGNHGLLWTRNTFLLGWDY